MTKVGVIFSNLGTPASPTPQAVGRYLAQFLMDPYVIQLPWLARLLLVRGIIVPFRKKKSAKNYQKVWQAEGSPLLIETRRAAQALQAQLGPGYQVEVAMRYGEPSFAQAADKLKDCERFIYFPQYPQYAESTTETGWQEYRQYFDESKTTVIEPYYQDPWFIEAYAKALRTQLQALQFDHLLMSFHGLPVSHVQRTDPTGNHCQKVPNCCELATPEILAKCYRAQCVRSAQALAKALGLAETKYTISFQSRLGRAKWLEPSTEDTYHRLLEAGVKKLAVICPGFSVDGLETLEEIALGGRETFLEGGGESFQFVPCLNNDPHWISACAEMIKAR